MFNKKRKIGRLRVSYGKTPQRFSRMANRPNNKFERAKKLFRFTLLLAAASLLIYGLLFSNFFKIKEIVIPGETFSDEALAAKITNSLKGQISKNIFFVDKEKISSKILLEFPAFESVKVNRDFPSKIEITFSQYPFAANIVNETENIRKTYIINSLGFVQKENFEDPTLPFIRVKTDEPVNIKEAIIEKNKLDYILNTMTYFEEKFGMKVKQALYKPIPRELHLLTEKDFYIWLDIQKPAEEQLKKLKKVLVKLDIYSQPLQYIDLRIVGNNGDKIIYKIK